MCREAWERGYASPHTAMIMQVSGFLEHVISEGIRGAVLYVRTSTRVFATPLLSTSAALKLSLVT